MVSAESHSLVVGTGVDQHLHHCAGGWDGKHLGDP